MRITFALLAALSATSPAFAAPVGDPVPYRARYDLFDERGDKVGATAFSLYGNACSGFATESITDLVGDAHEERMAFEPADGRSLEFSVLTGQGGKELSDVHGDARRAGGGVDVTVDDSGRSKSTRRFEGDVDFPAGYDRRVLAAALSGNGALVTGHVVDWHPGGDVRPVTVSSTVSDAVAPDGLPDALRGLRAFRVVTRFFPAGDADGEAEHVVSEVEYENGVTSEVEDTTGGHVLAMRLAALEMVPQAGCKSHSD